MPRYLIGIAPSDDLTAEVQTDLAHAGFEEAGQLEYEEAVWTGEDRTPEVVLRRTVYNYHAADREQAESDARMIVGQDFDIRIVGQE